MLGREPNDLAGKSIAEILGAEGFNTILPRIQQVLQGKRVDYESEIRYQGIGKRVIRAIYTPDHDPQGNVQGWVASLIDMSDRAHVARLRNQLASVVDFSNDAIVSEDLNGMIVSWNKGAKRIFGYSADEVVGKSITILMPSDLKNEEVSILEHMSRITPASENCASWIYWRGKRQTIWSVNVPKKLRKRLSVNYSTAATTSSPSSGLSRIKRFRAAALWPRPRKRLTRDCGHWSRPIVS